MASIRTSVEGARGCGYRKPGGLYLVSGRLTEPCPKLPVELYVCPTCGVGIKPARGWTWITPDPLLSPESHGSAEHSAVCPLGTAVDWSDGKRAGLIWIGESFYPTPLEFLREAREMGVSRRVTAVPRGFVVGETWVALAHRKTIYQAPANGDEEGTWLPGVFTLYLPTAVEYITKGDETEEELDALEERGLSLVRVVRDQAEIEEGA